MLRVLSDEHRKNFRALLANASAVSHAHSGGTVPNTNVANLLRFYAAEVGLKFLLNYVNKVPFKHEHVVGQQSVEGYGHHILKMVADLKIPAARVPKPPKDWHKCIGGFDDGSGGQAFQAAQAHEAWRYGLTIDAADQTELEAYFAGLIRYLEQEIIA